MKGKRSYVPERADLVGLTLDPQTGHEQAGRRPALVLSPASYNGRVGLALLCPITSQIKGYPFEVVLPANLPVSGAVLADQIKSLDWRQRRASRIGVVPDSVLTQVLERLNLLLGAATS